MSRNIHSSGSRRNGNAGLTRALIAIMALSSSAVFAHPIYTDHIEHRARIIIGSVNIDIELELTFNELRSLAERRRMDADGDGALSAIETKAYVDRLMQGFEQQLGLAIAGQALEVIPLYEPQLDLLGAAGIEPRHHVLRLFYFARTPSVLAVGDEVVLEDRLWNRAPALWSLQAEGRDGVAVGSTDSFGLDVPTTSPEGREPLRGRCAINAVPPRTAPPETGPATTSPSTETAIELPEAMRPSDPTGAVAGSGTGDWTIVRIGLAALLATAGGGAIYWFCRYRGAISCHRQSGA